MEKRNIPIIKTPFINLQSDFGFKRAFGSKKFKKVVIKFIRAAMGDEINIKRVVPHELNYHDKEILPSIEKGKRILYDVYFTLNIPKDNSGLKSYHIQKEEREMDIEHHFIFEMQNVYSPPLEDRMAYYAFKSVTEQGKTGWNYDLNPVILICLTDFDFPHLSKRLIHDFELREKETGEILTRKLRILFYSLKHVANEWEKCENDLERQLFLIKNMDKMDKNSKPYIEGGYKEYFEAAESDNIVGEEAVAYSQSLEHLQEVQAGLDFRYDQGYAIGEQRGMAIGKQEGIAIGKQEGIAIGEARGEQRERISLARRMKSRGYDAFTISDITGIPLREIEAL
ncbi:MAG: PD-(D/E)XK nuclease family transposase [Muribaculaceae bacterium]|nr:PD-(D/E)XK nuclease family transposase [Muribaculaceae bacterium]